MLPPCTLLPPCTANCCPTAQLAAALSQDFQVDYVILAGYLKLIPSQLCRAFRRRILNIHPGLLPSFGGKGYYGIKARRCWEP